MHWVENKSVKTMAKELGCSRAGIYNAMRRERVQWRGMSAAKIVMHAQTRLEERVARTVKARAERKRRAEERKGSALPDHVKPGDEPMNKTVTPTDQCCADAPTCAGHGGHHILVSRMQKPSGLTPGDIWMLHLHDCNGCTAIGYRCSIGERLSGGKVYREKWNTTPPPVPSPPSSVPGD